jgi:ubiquinone/menaquinone biosynthesis C-methylase UbiE
MTAGNVTAKYPPANPLAGPLVRRWRAALLELVAVAAPRSLLDLGCGEGVLTAEWARRLPGTQVLGVDVADVVAVPERPNLRFATIAPAPPLPYADGAWDLVAAVESLEHMEDPEGALAEMARCARRHVLVSVPREPLWRALNLARGAYVRAGGNTPGHRQHFTPAKLRALLAGHGEVLAARSPAPWTVALARVYS